MLLLGSAFCVDVYVVYVCGICALWEGIYMNMCMWRVEFTRSRAYQVESVLQKGENNRLHSLID